MVTTSPFVFGIQNSNQNNGTVDIKTARVIVLKVLGNRPASFSELLSMTGMGEGQLKDAVSILMRDELIEGSDEKYVLTSMGERAQYVVSAS